MPVVDGWSLRFRARGVYLQVNSLVVRTFFGAMVVNADVKTLLALPGEMGET